MNADWEPGGLLIEAWSELHAVMAQRCLPDGSISILRVGKAYELLEIARLAAIKEESAARYEDQWCGDRPAEEDSNVVPR